MKDSTVVALKLKPTILSVIDSQKKVAQVAKRRMKGSLGSKITQQDLESQRLIKQELQREILKQQIKLGDQIRCYYGGQ